MVQLFDRFVEHRTDFVGMGPIQGGMQVQVVDILAPFPQDRSDVVDGIEDLGRTDAIRPGTAVQLDQPSSKVVDQFELEFEKLQLLARLRQGAVPFANGIQQSNELIHAPRDLHIVQIGRIDELPGVFTLQHGVYLVGGELLLDCHPLDQILGLDQHRDGTREARRVAERRFQLLLELEHFVDQVAEQRLVLADGIDVVDQFLDGQLHQNSN